MTRGPARAPAAGRSGALGCARDAVRHALIAVHGVGPAHRIRTSPNPNPQTRALCANASKSDHAFRGLERIADNYPKSVLRLDDMSLGEGNGIDHRCLWEIL